MSPHPYPLAVVRSISGCPKTFDVTMSLNLPDGSTRRFRLGKESVEALIDLLPYWRDRLASCFDNDIDPLGGAFDGTVAVEVDEDYLNNLDRGS